MRGSDGDGWDFFMWGGGGLVGSGDGVAINRQGGGGGDELVCRWRHKHSSIEVLYNILN